jgi:dTMP kinase
LEAKKTIVVNRYSESNTVYGLANGLQVEWLATLERGIPKPDLVLVLDAPHTPLASRRPGTKDAYERDSDLQSRAARLYRELAPRFGWVLVDATKEIQTVHESLIEVVKERINTKWRGRQRR